MNMFLLLLSVVAVSSATSIFNNSTSVSLHHQYYDNNDFEMCPAPEFEALPSLEQQLEEYEELVILFIEIHDLPFASHDDVVEEEEEEQENVEEASEDATEQVTEVWAPEVEIAAAEKELHRIVGFFAQLAVLFCALSLLTFEAYEELNEESSFHHADENELYELQRAEEIEPMALKCKPRKVLYIGAKAKKVEQTSDC